MESRESSDSEDLSDKATRVSYETRRRPRRRSLTRVTRSSGRSRARVSRGGSRGGRRSRSRGGEPGEKTQKEVDELRDSRLEKLQTDVDALSEEEVRELLKSVIARAPGLVFDMLHPVQVPKNPEPDVPGHEVSKWCICDHCQQMPTPAERVCCGFTPEQCLSLRPEMDIGILDVTVLAIAMAYQEDLLGYVDYDPSDMDGDTRKGFRHAAYRQFVLWEYGKLGGGNRVVIPSCCVWRIRTKFPDPFNRYVGFKYTDMRVPGQDN